MPARDHVRARADASLDHALYLHRGLSEVLFRVPPIRSEHLEAVACETLDALQAAVRTSFHTVLMVEWSPALVTGLDV